MVAEARASVSKLTLERHRFSLAERMSMGRRLSVRGGFSRGGTHERSLGRVRVDIRKRGVRDDGFLAQHCEYAARLGHLDCLRWLREVPKTKWDRSKSFVCAERRVRTVV